MSFLAIAAVGNLQTFEGYSATPFWVVLLIIFILALFFWYGQNRKVSTATGGHDAHGHDDHGHDDHGHGESVRSAEVAVPLATEGTAVSEPPAPVAIEPDDLKKIEGIGPKISGILQEAGISTFTQLANTAVADLERIVREEGGIRLAKPDTWPEQAALAAAHDWDGLEKLQDELTGGRRTD